MTTTQRSETAEGLAYGVGAYLLWGVVPLYWPLLEPASALEVLAHRVVWSLVTVGVLLLVTRRWSQALAVTRDPRRMAYVVAGAVVVAINWGTFIYAVNSDHVVEASLGYFINPLVTIALGVVFLRERLRPVQWCALALALAAVVELTWEYGRLPVIALTLALSFGVYGLMKKQAAIGAVEGLALETFALAPVAAAYLGYLAVTGALAFGSHGLGHALLLASTGLVTAVPLLLFGGAATRLTLTALGLLQYLAPILQFAVGVFVFHEAMTTGRWVGFALVWAALVLITVEATRHHRRTLRESASNLV
ncbi:EamA family transporter RarD [Mumia sp. zg.B53]|uniref:EamA family transporter RarD n=1 Tax=unclassified Mumia TaxID=2621872 RepID=UPI001C6F577D|nr:MULTISPECIES: EamA family transporter RarD [unclassified Mumia]MBW9204614.1 EamA family transporter RarD [Mumia sp. zg.B17]MBW9213990.1 EamA family transporter RarD [Mumia sp. zg.B53]